MHETDVIHILIDTCVWKILVLTDGINDDLMRLLNWVDSGKIKIICPEILKKEWEEHRENEKNKIDKSVENKLKNERLLGSAVEEKRNEVTRLLNKQIDIIDKILLQKSINIPTPDEIHAKVSKRQVDKKFPFNNNKEKTSHKDALLIFTSIHYIKESSISKFTFVTTNPKDFGNPDNYAKQLHPDYLNEMNVNELNYFSVIPDFFAFLDATLPLQFVQNTPTINKIIINEFDHPLDQIYNYFEILFCDLNVIPSQYWINNYPINSNEKYGAYKTGWTLNINNDKLFASLNEIIKDNNTEQPQQTLQSSVVNNLENKLRYVYDKFIQNAIFFIGCTNKSGTLTIPTIENSKCGCIKCKTFSLDILSKLSGATSVNDFMSNGYYQYKLGNPHDAYAYYKKAASLSKTQSKWDTYYLSKYNMKNLEGMLKYSFNVSSFEIDQIDTTQLLAEIEHKTNNYKLLRNIDNNQFLYEYYYKISKLTASIRNTYKISKEGGWSRNSDFTELSSAFVELEYFISNNFIVYDHFLDFQDLFDLYTEAIFAAHAISDPDSSILSSLNDYQIQTLIYYGKPKTLRRYIFQYEIKKIQYRNSVNNLSFESIALGLLGAEYIAFVNTGTQNFKETYIRMLSNCIVISSYIKCSNSFIDNYCDKLINLLNDESILRGNHVEFIVLFMSKHGNLLKKTSLKKIVILLINNDKYYNHNLIEVMSDILVKKPIELNAKHLQLLTNRPLNSDIVYFGRMLINKQKDIIVNLIQETLEQNFDSDLYYMSVLYDIIPFIPNNFFKSFIKKTVPSQKKKYSPYLKRDENRYTDIDKLLNVCFKEKIELPKTLVKKIQKLDIYYAWLLNLDSFDYSKFDPKWLNHYPTRFYYEKFYSSEKLKDNLLLHIKNNGTTEFKDLYTDISLQKLTL